MSCDDAHVQRPLSYSPSLNPALFLCVSETLWRNGIVVDVGGGSQSCRVAPRRVLLCFHFVWFGHLGGPIMENCASLCICKFTKKVVGNNVFSFQQNKGVFQHRRGLFLQNKGSFQQNKGKTDHILRQPTRANTKSATKHPVGPSKRPVFSTFTLFTLTQPIYTPAEGGLVHLDHGLSVQNPAWGDGNPCGCDLSSCHFVGDAE